MLIRRRLRAHLRINFELHSAHAIRNFQASAKIFPLQIEQNTPHLVQGHFEGENVNLGEDFVATYDLDPAASDTLQMLTYRNPGQRPAFADRDRSGPQHERAGLFRSGSAAGLRESRPLRLEARLSAHRRRSSCCSIHRLSMQWEKLERSYQALETLLHTLRPADHFSLVLFNTETQIVPVSSADTANIQHAIDFVRASRLRGGTDLQRALQAGLQQVSAPGASKRISSS